MPIVQSADDPIWDGTSARILFSKFGLADPGLLKACEPPRSPYDSFVGEIYSTLPNLGDVLVVNTLLPTYGGGVKPGLFSPRNPCIGIVVGASVMDLPPTPGQEVHRMSYSVRIFWTEIERCLNHSLELVRSHMSRPRHMLSEETILSQKSHKGRGRTEREVTKRVSFRGPAIMCFSALSGEVVREVRVSISDTLSCNFNISGANLVAAASAASEATEDADRVAATIRPAHRDAFAADALATAQQTIRLATGRAGRPARPARREIVGHDPRYQAFISTPQYDAWTASINSALATAENTPANPVPNNPLPSTNDEDDFT